MHDVFGDGREYEEHYAALVEAPEEDETQEKVEIRYDAVRILLFISRQSP